MRIAVDGMIVRHETGDDTSTSVLPVVKYMMEKAVDDQGCDADYTRVLRTLEESPLKAEMQNCITLPACLPARLPLYPIELIGSWA